MGPLALPAFSPDELRAQLAEARPRVLASAALVASLLVAGFAFASSVVTHGHGVCPHAAAAHATCPHAQQAQQAQARAGAAHVAAALDVYRLERGHYPSTARGLQELVEPARGAAVVGDIRFLEDPWGHGFVYALAPCGHGFTLTSRGADHVLGSDDDVTVLGGAR